MKKRILFILLFFVSFFVFSTKVSAIKTGSFDCDKEEYQCISCSYARAGGTHHFTYYVKSNKDGALSIIGEGKENLVTFDYSTESSYFLNSSKDGMICPDVYMQGTAVYQDSYQIKVTFTKEPDINLTGGYVSESLLATLESSNNNKPLKAEGQTAESVICENVKIANLGQSKQNTTIINIWPDKFARVIVAGENISLELPSGLAPSENPTASFTSKEFENGCPEDLLVSCWSYTKGYKGDRYYECNLVHGSQLDDRYIDGTTGDPINVQWQDITAIDWDKIKYTGDCSDVEIFRFIWLFIIIGAPFLVIVLGSMDFFRMVINTDPESKKKNQKKFVRRIIALVILLFVPFIIQLIINNFAPSDSSASNLKLMKCIINGK